MKLARGSAISAVTMALTAVLVSAAVLAGGCGLTEDSGSKSTTSVRPKHDRVKTTSDDWIVGRLKLDEFQLVSPHLGKVPLKRADVQEIRFEGDTDSVRTRFGDILKGRLEVSTFPFRAEIGRDTTFERARLKLIELAN